MIDNKIHGLKKEWYPNGKIYRESYYAMGLLHGIRQIWSESGQLLSKINYQFGRNYD